MKKLNLHFLLLFCCTTFAQQHTKQQINTIAKALLIKRATMTRAPQKKATFMVYVAADNDLHIFAWKNIRQLAEIAPQNINIVVFLTEPGRNKKTQIYLVEKNRSILLNKENQTKLDSGDAKTLSDFCSFSIEKFPADNYILILWNHGTGILDPVKNPFRSKSITPSELFTLNPETLKIEIDRTTTFLEFIEEDEEQMHRGVCFDDTHNSYLNNQKLEQALITLKNGALKNKKFHTIGMDACLMSMVEVANIFKEYADNMIASQEIELGAGWRYDKVMKYFIDNDNLDNLNKHTVQTYKDTYDKITPDYTLSSIDLNRVNDLEQAVDNLALRLIDSLNDQIDNTVKATLQQSKRNIGFEEPTYVDLATLCNNILQNATKMRNKNEATLVALRNACNTCLQRISAAVTANTHGDKVKYATGISIYFPEKNIHSSYSRTNFATKNNWHNFLLKYISS